MKNSKRYARECHIRDTYAKHLIVQRPHERVVKREVRYSHASLRVDLRTIDCSGILREWEFKLHAGYHALGQILVYVACARQEYEFRPIRGVIAAFTFSKELQRCVEIMNLNIELVKVPMWMRCGGAVPDDVEKTAIVNIPRLAN